MKSIPQIVIFCADCLNYGKAISSIQKTLDLITPAKAFFFTDIPYQSNQFDTIQIKTLKSAKEYSRWMLKEAINLVTIPAGVTHVLIIQHDSWVLSPDQWTDEFLSTDYLGAIWPFEKDKYNQGNGGFCLRSIRLMKILADDSFILPLHPEDNTAGKLYRDYLEMQYQIVFAPDELARKFSFELESPRQPTFGFHNFHHQPYRPYIVLQRLGALGDVVQIEPVMQWYHENGYNVVLDSPFFDLFGRHRFPVINYEKFDKEVIPHKVINLDMAYEIDPARLHLQCYFDICGISDPLIKAPQLDHYISAAQKLFNRYIVIHIDTRETTHRNVHGVNWEEVVDHIEHLGYIPIQIGQGEAEVAGIRLNTVNIPLLNWVISGCDLFLGVDSGPSHIAVALGRKCILFFGSVKPEYIHPDLTNVTVLQSRCPIAKDYCWHSTPSTRGVDCPVDIYQPPCTIIDTDDVIKAINRNLPA